jgi:hypothetical protein
MMGIVKRLAFFGAAWLFLSSGYGQASDEAGRTGAPGRDPFIPLITPAGYLMNIEPQANAALRLEGVTFDPHGGSIAVINGKLVQVGDEISGAVVTSIESARVTVIQDNKKIDLELRREE